MPRPDDDASPESRDAPTDADAGAADTVLGASTPSPSAGRRPGDSTGDGGSSGPIAIAAAGARYALGRVLGRGGMGEVRLARDPRVDRDVAVKVLRDPSASPEAVARFLREARVQGRLEHPAVVPVHDLGVDERGAPYFAMKRLSGTTLADAIAAVRTGDAAARQRWPRRLLLDRLADVCLAIEFAHERGVVHRDLKPSNIMLGDHGEAYVLDWGIARVGSEAGAIHRVDLAPLDTDTGGGGGQTAAGSLLGTPGYMAPEQMRGERVDPRADVYALGLMLFEILTGEPALPAGSAAFEATLGAGAFRPRERRADADIAPELDDACARATAPSPDDRIGSARELAAAIRAYLDGDRDLGRRRELAQLHASAATRAHAAGDAGRADAMREAGRAIAIDPECREAQDLLGRLMFEPPAVTVPAVAAAVDAERHRESQVHLLTAAKVYAAFLTLIPAMLVLGARLSWPLAGLGVAVTINLVLCAWGSRQNHAPIGMIYLTIVNHAVQLALVGILFGPLIILPAVAIGSVAAFTAYPILRRPLVIVAAHAIGIAIPFALELGGAVPRTYSVDGGTITLHPWAVGVSGTLLVIMALIALAAQIVSTTVLTVNRRRAQESAQEQLHLHKWHVDQLLPEHARR